MEEEHSFFKKVLNALKKAVFQFNRFFSVKNNLYTGLVIVLLPIALTLTVEMLSRSSFLAGWQFLFEHPVPFFVNACIIACTVLLALLFKRRAFVYLVVSACWVALGCINMGMLHARVTPFNATDIFMIKTGLRIADKYIKPAAMVTYIAVAILVIAFLVFVWLKGPKIQEKIRRVRNAVVIACMAVVTLIAVSVALDTGFIASNFNNLPNAYKAYGFTYCFLNSIFDNGVDKPENYSNEEIIELVDESEHGEIEITQVTDATPNIIMVQLESFFDITRMDNLEFSEDPIPYFRSLMENYNWGYIDVPSIGAGTSNTEFEVLTGMNLEDFGSGEIPYKGILLKETCESMAYDLGRNGYTSHAIHNNDGTFYQRHTVYPNLGFDTFTTMEYMQLKPEDYTPIKWVRDEILTDCINDCLNSTEDGTDFIFTVSVEGHGSYPNYYVSGMNEIRVTNVENRDTSYATQYYTNLIHDMDRFIEKLITSLSERNEPTILILYGDHFPSLGLEQEHLKDGTLTQTEYVVWNNMGLSFDFGNIQTYQLMPRLLGALGIEEGVINSYHQTHINDEEDEYLSGLQNLEYDLLYGGKAAFGGINPYPKKNMKFGIKDIEITGVYKTIEDEKTYLYVSGNNLTKWSMINVNGDYYKTEMIDFNLVRCEYNALPMDEIFLAQVGKDKYQLSRSEGFIYK